MSIQRIWIRLTVVAVIVGGTAILCAADTIPVSREVPAPAPSASSDPFGEQIERAIQVTAQRRLTAGVHTPWQVVHGILAQRWDLALLKRENPGEEVSAIEWIMGGATFDGEPLWQATPYGGRGHAFTRPYAFEGHPTQFMGYMTMANIPLDYEVKTPDKIVTIRDIIQDAKMNVHTGVEITWTLWTLAHYEEPDAHWFNAAGEPWSIERLVKMQVDEPATAGACGGCHGLFALAYARNMYLSTHKGDRKALRGVWFEADQKIKQHIALARALQNADGSFSTDHFKGPGYSDDFTTRITTSGHQLEWLMIALSQREIEAEWFKRAIANVARDLINNRHVASDCGPLFHGMHALVVYRQRTVPGYLVPKFNSHIKLAERGKTKTPAGVAATIAPKAKATAPAAPATSPAAKTVPVVIGSTPTPDTAPPAPMPTVTTTPAKTTPVPATPAATTTPATPAPASSPATAATAPAAPTATEVPRPASPQAAETNPSTKVDVDAVKK